MYLVIRFYSFLFFMVLRFVLLLGGVVN